MAETTINFKEFTGLRNDVPSYRFSPSDLAFAKNVDVDDSGSVSRRDGYELKVAGSIRSLWSDSHTCLFAQDTYLKQLLSDYTTRTLASTLIPTANVAYAGVDTRIFWTDGVSTGVIQNGQNRSWGITPPTHQPDAEATVGKLCAGDYQYAVTYVRNDGQESGTGLAGLVTLTELSGIRFTNIPVSDDPTVELKRLYLSGANGDMMYFVGSMDNATTVATIMDEVTATDYPLQTQFLSPPPAGDLLAYYKAHLLVIAGQVVFYSKPFNYELFDPRDFYVLPDAVTIVAPSEDGVFLTTHDSTWFLNGSEVGKFSLERADGEGGIRGTLSYVPISVLRDTLKLNYMAGYIPVWTTKSGIAYGLPRGQIISPTIPKFYLPQAQYGASIFYNSNGINRYITSMYY